MKIFAQALFGRQAFTTNNEAPGGLEPALLKRATMIRTAPARLRLQRKLMPPLGAVLVAAGLGSVLAAEPDFPITPQQREAARQVAGAGVPLAELAPDAPDAYTVKPGDTLWGISGLFLKRAWRWPELWGMNLEQIRNPHLIYPGQILVLERSGDRAQLRMASGVPTGTDKLSPRVRDMGASTLPIAAVPLRAIEAFLGEAVIFSDDQLQRAPRIVAAQEGRVLIGKGDAAYVRGEIGNERLWQIFRQPRALTDPLTQQVLGYEGVHVGTASYEAQAGTNERGEAVPATFRITSARVECNVEDRLIAAAARDFEPYVPRAPSKPVDGRIVSVYGDALNAGQNQIVALNKGRLDGLERGHVLALWRAGAEARDGTVEGPAQPIRLPDERHGTLFVFRVFEKMAYALILEVREPVTRGDRFSQP